MVKRVGTFRTKTRHKLSKSNRCKGKVSVSRYFQEFSDGQKVALNAEPAVQNGMYFPRFHGKIGVVAGKQGECYKVTLKDMKKEKMLLVHPVHLRKV